MSQVTFTRPDGKEASGYYVEPAAGAQAPGIVIVQEWWGVNDQIKGVARRLAGRGYRALVPDLYRGEVGLDAKEAQHLMEGLNFGEAAGLDIGGAVRHLKQTGSSKVGVTGFCMGGALALLAAANVPEIDATAAWYGLPPLEYIDPSKITAPLLGHFATRDAFFKIEQVDALAQKLDQAGVPYTFHRYDAQHAFANEAPTDPNIPTKYDAAAAEQAWQRTLAFFDQHLAPAQHAV
jgi:carboxymethylenebutenolidase